MPPSPSPSSFTSSNRLLHISDLVNSKVYTQSNISSLLSLNKKSLRQNILTIIHQWIKQQKFSNKLLVYDKNLVFPLNNNNNNNGEKNINNSISTSINYDNIKGGWCQDIDLQYDQEKNRSVYLRQSMKIVIMILNYLYVIVNMDNSKKQIKQNNNNDDIITKGQLAQMKLYNNTFMSRISSTQHKYPVMNNIQQQHCPITSSFCHQFINLQTTPQCFTSPLPQLFPPYIISYNIYKKHKKYIFLTATHSHPSSQYFNLISLFRSYNLSRLQINKNIGFSSIEKLFRSHVYLQHLFTIARGFGFSSLRSKQLKYLDKEIPKCDVNQNKKYLKKLIERLNINEKMDDDEFVNQMRNKQPQIFNVLQNTLKIYRFSITFKQPTTQQQQHNQPTTQLLFSRLLKHFHHILSFLLSSLPIQIPISYHFHCIYSSQCNKITFIILFNYNSHVNSSYLCHLYLTKCQIYNTMKNICEYVNNLMYEEIREKQKNVADEMFKSSIKIFTKFNQYSHGNINNINNSNMKKSNNMNNMNNNNNNRSTNKLFDNQNNYQQKFNQLKSSNINMMKQLSQSRSSPIKQLNPHNPHNNLSYNRSQTTTTKISYPNNTSNAYKFPLLSSQVTNIPSRQIQKQFGLLSESLCNRLSNQCLLCPSQVSQFLSRFFQLQQQSYDNSLCLLSLEQKLSLKFISKWSNLLSSQQIFLLIDKYKDNMDQILDLFIQQHNFVKIIDVAKIIVKKNAEILFKIYTNDKNKFHKIRYHYLINYIKKLLQFYYLNNIKQLDKIRTTNMISLRQSSNKISYKQSPNKISLRQSPNKKLSLRQSPNKISLKQYKTDNNNNKFKQVNIQQLIYLLQQRQFSSQQYKSLLLTHLNQLFLSHPSTPYISSILSQLYLTLLSFDHHPDLISSFIAQLFFQVVYFTTQSSSIKLNNSLYRKNVVNLKQKKLYQIIREGGFINVGYQLKNTWLKELLQIEEYVHYQKLIVTNIKIKNIYGFKNVLKMIQCSHMTGNYQQMIQQIHQKSSYFDALNDNNRSYQISQPFYYKQIIQMSLNSYINTTTKNNNYYINTNNINNNNNMNNNNSKQKHQYLQHLYVNQPCISYSPNPLSNITLSQSGIFKQLFQLNPDIKICGLSVKQQYTRKIQQIQKQHSKFTLINYLKNILKLNIQQAWEQIILIKQLEERYKQIQIKKEIVNYDRLIIQGETNKQEINKLNNQVVEINNDIQRIYTKMTQIYQYIALSDVVIECKKRILSI